LELFLSRAEWCSSGQTGHELNRDNLGWWKLAAPEEAPRPEAAGLDKEEADFVSKYLALADELLKEKPGLFKKTG